MGSLQNLARGGRPGSVGLGGLGEGRGGMGPPMGGQPAHSQGLQGGRLTPTHFGGGGGRSMGGLGGHSMGLLQSSVANSRNPLFSRKMGWEGKFKIASVYTQNKCHVVQYQGLPSFQGRKPTLTYFFSQGRAWWSSFRPFGLPIFRWWCWRSSWGIRQKQLW